jgi:hypothetical protein
LAPARVNVYYVEKARKPTWRKGTLQAGGMNGKQGLGECNPHQGLFPANALHRKKKIAPTACYGILYSSIKHG